MIQLILHQAKKIAELRHIEYLQSICKDKVEYEKLRAQWISTATELVKVETD